MIAILIMFALYGFKFAEMSFMENVSWWIVNGYAALLFIWFQFLERLLGFDKRHADLHHEVMRKKRVKRTFEAKKKK